MNDVIGLESLNGITRGMWRYRWQAMATAWLIMLVGWPVAFLLSEPKFTAKAQIYIDTQSVLSPVLKGLTIPTNASEQLGLMSRQLLAGPNLERVVAETGLGRETDGAAPSDIVLENLRRSISLNAERTSSESGYTNFYSISYVSRDPALAERVVQALIDAFAANTLSQVKEDADEAARYLDGQIQARKDQILRAEQRLREFQRQHVGALSSGTEGYFQRLSAAKDALRDVELEIEKTKARAGEIGRQLATTPARVEAIGDDGLPVLSPAEKRLSELRAQLDQALLKFTDSHPTIVKLRESIALLQAEVGRGTHRGPTVLNPLREQLVLRASDIKATLAELDAKRELYARRVDDLHSQMQTLPGIEDELKGLMEEAQKAREAQQALLDRRQGFDTSRKAAENDAPTPANDDIRFRLVEPPSVPVESTLLAAWKRRLIMAAAVLAAAIVGGAGFAYLKYHLQPPIFSQRELGEVTGLPVYGVVALVTNREWRSRRRLDAMAFGLCVILILAAATASIYFQRALTYAHATAETALLQRALEVVKS